MEFLPTVISKALEAEKTNNWRQDKLHVSSDLQGCVKKACLEMSEISNDIDRDQYQDIRMKIGTGMHNFIGRYLRENYDVQVEKEVTEGLPEGWMGTADYVITEESSGEVAVYDLKVVSSSLKYFSDMNNEFAQTSSSSSKLPLKEHIWQVSSYVYALRKMGINATRGFICYLFIDNYYHYGQKFNYNPAEYEVDLVPVDELSKKFKEVTAEVELWKQTSQLPPDLEPEQKLKAKPSWKKPERIIVEQRMNWKCKGCPFYPRNCQPNPFEGVVGEFRYDPTDNTYYYLDKCEGAAKPLIFPPGVAKENIKNI